MRRYPKHVLIQVEERADYTRAGYRGFSPLFHFISGRNSARETIAMTAPVLQREVSDGVYSVAFVMPLHLPPERVPRPLDSHLTSVTIEEHLVAVATFSGLWSEAKFDRAARHLRQAVMREGFSPQGLVYSARYDPPWKPGFLRKNEALLDLE